MKTLSGACGDRPSTQNRGLQRRLTQTMSNWSKNHNRDEHKSALEKMQHTAEWLRSAQQDEEEAQRLQFARKVEERKQTRARHAARAAARKVGSQDGVTPEARTLLSAQPLGPMPGVLEPTGQSPRVSPTFLEGRPVPMALEMDDAPDGPTETDTPAGSPTNNSSVTPAAAGSPIGESGCMMPAGSPPDESGFMMPVGSPTSAACSPESPQPPSSPVGSQLPPPP